MKCSVIVENFRKPLSLIERNTTKNITLPILGSFFISTEKGLIRVIGTNLEIGVETFIRGTIQEQGRVVIPAKIFLSFISTIQKDEKITLESKKTDLVVETQSQKTVFKGFSPEDFPLFPTIQEDYSITLKKTDLINTLGRCLISISRSLIKPELSSLFFLLEKEFLTIAATDSFRLSEEKIKLITPQIKAPKNSFLMPLRTCEELLKLLELGDENQVKFSIGKGEVFVQYAGTTLYSRLTEGNFPEYGDIIPKQFKTNVKISRQTLLGHLRRASLFTNKLNGISLTFDPEKNECKIECVNRDVGEYQATFPIDASGDPVSIVFNYHYLLEGLDSFHDETLFLGFNGEAQSLLIHPLQKEESLYIVMPMKGGI